MEIVKKHKNKVIILTVIVLLFNFIIPNVSHAGIKSFLVENVGGALLEPIMNFVMFLGDTVINAFQTNIYPGSEAFFLARIGGTGTSKVITGVEFIVRSIRNRSYNSYFGNNIGYWSSNRNRNTF